MNRDQVIKHIQDNSQFVNQLSYDKRTGNSIELRNTNGHVFMLQLFDGGKKGYDLYLPTRTNSLGDDVKLFNELLVMG